MPLSKRRPAASQKSTLHDFFGTGLSSNNCKTPLRPHERDVVVIDSDSDDDPVEIVQIVESSVKRKRLSVDFDAVELPGQPDRRRTRTHDTTSQDEKVGLNDASSDLTSHSPFMSFGSPSDLLKPKNESKDSNSSAQLELYYSATASSSSSLASPDTFEEPTLLLTSDSKPSLPSNDSTSRSSADMLERTHLELDLNISIDDWARGDDEANTMPDMEEDLEDLRLNISSAAALSEESSMDQLQNAEFDFFSEDSTEEYTMRRRVDSVLGSSVQATGFTSFESKPFSVQTPSHSTTSNEKSNAFSVLMASHKENEAWKEATAAEDPTFRPTKGNGGRRKAPFYKVLQGMPIAVDAFRYGTIPGITAYFLTHAHSDHYTNLASNWKSGPIYCSEGTANLIIHMLSVDPKWVHPLPMDTPTIVPNTNGVKVTLIEANHCPGSCLFFFEGRQTVNAGDSAFKSPHVGTARIFRYLHCGDFRASPRHVLHPAVKGKRIDHVYLDTTYLDSKYSFPPQALVISACAELARRLLKGGPVFQVSSTVDSWMTASKSDQNFDGKKNGKTLIVIGTYSIGKERIVKAIAKALGSRIYCDSRKAAILRCQADHELDCLLTDKPLDAIVHLVPLGLVTTDKLKLYADRFKGEFAKVIGFRPTGWSFTPPAGTDQLPAIQQILSRSQQRDFTYLHLRPARNSTSNLQLYPVPYSEHSSFYELTCFAMSFNWNRMIATVNVGSENSRARMAKWVAKWDGERRKAGKDSIVPYRHPDYW